MCRSLSAAVKTMTNVTVSESAKLGPIRTQFASRLTTGGEHLLDHLDKQRRLDRAWLKDLLADIRANGIRDVADPAALAR